MTKQRIPNALKPDFGIRLPKSGTTALAEYVESFRRINEFEHFVFKMVTYIENAEKNLHKVRLATAKSEEEKKEVEEKWSRRKGPLEDLRKNRQLFSEMLLVRHVENYLNYLSSLLRIIFIARPESLRSQEKIDLETVLKHDSIDDLVKTIAERKVESLSYSSFHDLSAYFSDKFSIDLLPPSEAQSAVNAIEARNISVHNRCIVNRRYLAKTKRTDVSEGEHLSVGIDTVEDAVRVFVDSAISVDKAARKNLGISGKQFSKGAGNL